MHRDVKPDNILLTDVDGALTLKLIDFGGAVVLGKEEKATDLFGTYNYLAP